MSLFAQTILVFGLALVVLGYFAYRKRPDILEVGKLLARPSYWGPALIITIAYLILKVILGGVIKFL